MRVGQYRYFDKDQERRPAALYEPPLRLHVDGAVEGERLWVRAQQREVDVHQREPLERARARQRHVHLPALEDAAWVKRSEK